MGARREVDGRDPLLLLIEILRFVIDQEIVGHDLVLLAESVVEEHGVSSEPLVGHFMFDQDGVVDADGPSCGLESHVGVGVLQDPACVVIVLQHEQNLLKPRHLGFDKKVPSSSD